MLDSISDLAYSILVAVVTLLVFFIVGKFVQMLSARILRELQLDFMLEKIGIEFSGSKFVASIIAFAFYFWGIVVALKQLGLERIALITISLILGIFLTLSLALGFADTVKNFFIGVYLRKKYVKSREIKVGNVKGKIIHVGKTKVKVMTKDKDILAVPYTALK